MYQCRPNQTDIEVVIGTSNRRKDRQNRSGGVEWLTVLISKPLDKSVHSDVGPIGIRAAVRPKRDATLSRAYPPVSSARQASDSERHSDGSRTPRCPRLSAANHLK